MSVTVYPFTYANLKSSVNARLHNKLGVISDPRTIIDDAVSEVSDIYLRSAKRKGPLAPNLFNDIYQYAAPTDIDGNKIIGLQPQSMDRDRNNIWELVTEEEFDIRKQTDSNLIAVADNTLIRTLLVSSQNRNLRELTLASLQGLTGDGAGTWAAVGTATNLATNNYNFIKGNGAVQFDFASGTAAGIKNSSLATFDLTYYQSGGSIFTWVDLPTVANFTNIVFDVGSSATNYYEMTATTPNDGTSFVVGWNLVRFDLATKTTIGTPVATAGTYAALTLNYSVAPATTGFRLNWLNVKQGQISNLVYYSKFPWESATGTYLKNSIADTDYLVCDQDEYSLFVEKCVEVVGMGAREYNDAKLAADKYEKLSAQYKRDYPSEALAPTQTYYYINSGNKGR